MNDMGDPGRFGPGPCGNGWLSSVRLRPIDTSDAMQFLAQIKLGSRVDPSKDVAKPAPAVFDEGAELVRVFAFVAILVGAEGLRRSRMRSSLLGA
jgi:hypothetical protein